MRRLRPDSDDRFKRSFSRKSRIALEGSCDVASRPRRARRNVRASATTSAYRATCPSRARARSRGPAFASRRARPARGNFGRLVYDMSPSTLAPNTVENAAVGAGAGGGGLSSPADDAASSGCPTEAGAPSRALWETSRPSGPSDSIAATRWTTPGRWTPRVRQPRSDRDRATSSRAPRATISLATRPRTSPRRTRVPRRKPRPRRPREPHRRRRERARGGGRRGGRSRFRRRRRPTTRRRPPPRPPPPAPRPRRPKTATRYAPSSTRRRLPRRRGRGQAAQMRARLSASPGSASSSHRDSSRLARPLRRRLPRRRRCDRRRRALRRDGGRRRTPPRRGDRQRRAGRVASRRRGVESVDVTPAGRRDNSRTSSSAFARARRVWRR